MKAADLAAPAHDRLVALGFKAVKPHSFMRVVAGVFQHVSFQAQGGDRYVWHAALPVSLPELNPHAGWLGAVGRFPRWREETEAGPADLVGGVVGSTLPLLDALSDLSALATAYESGGKLAPYAIAFCRFQQGRHDEGKAALRRVPDEPPGRWETKIARRYLDADADALDAMVAAETRANLKKLGLLRTVTAPPRPPR